MKKNRPHCFQSNFNSGFLVEISNDSLLLNKSELLKVLRQLKLFIDLLDPHISIDLLWRTEVAKPAGYLYGEKLQNVPQVWCLGISLFAQCRWHYMAHTYNDKQDQA